MGLTAENPDPSIIFIFAKKKTDWTDTRAYD